MPAATDDAGELAAYLSRHLPLTSALGVRVRAAGDDAVRLGVPLAPNLNHEQTAFGGSLSAVGMLGGWGLIWLRARRLSPTPRLVIAESQTRFIRPVDADFEAFCAWPRPELFDEAAATLARAGRARIALRTELTVGGRVAAVHDGTFALVSTRADAARRG